MKSFYSIQSVSQGFYKEKGSKFYAYAFPAASEEQVSEHLEALRMEYPDANHHCFAWVIGLESQVYRVNNDGEPNHSAGDPIMGQIRSFGLTNVLLVVVRYFGGTKLGVGGLIQAYRTAAEKALERAAIIEVFEWATVTLSFEYEAMSSAERIIHEFQLEVKERIFRESCRIIASAKKRDIEKLKKFAKSFYTIHLELET